MAGKKSLVTVTDSGNRLETLVALRHKLATAIEQTESARDIAPLSKQLREVMEEIDTIKQAEAPQAKVTVLEMIRSKHEAKEA